MLLGHGGIRPLFLHYDLAGFLQVRARGVITQAGPVAEHVVCRFANAQ